MLPIIHLSETIQIYSYPFFLGIAVALFVAYSEILNQEVNVFNKKQFYGLMAVVLVSAWVGAKLLFYITVPDSIQVKVLPFVLGGGFVFYGAPLFAFPLAILYLYIIKIKIIKLELLVPPLLLAHAVGRIGCFLAGCCYGCETLSVIGIEVNGSHRIPVQLYESLFLIFLFFLTKHYFKNSQKRISVLGLYLLLYGIFRFIIEFFRDDTIRGIWFNQISTSQIISICATLFGAYCLINRRRKNV